MNLAVSLASTLMMHGQTQIKFVKEVGFICSVDK
jgi:hypothetical protein